jgi:hypothetical protein
MSTKDTQRRDFASSTTRGDTVSSNARSLLARRQSTPPTSRLNGGKVTIRTRWSNFIATYSCRPGILLAIEVQVPTSTPPSTLVATPTKSVAGCCRRQNKQRESRRPLKPIRSIDWKLDSVFNLCTHVLTSLWKVVLMTRVSTRTVTYLTIRRVTLFWRGS